MRSLLLLPILLLSFCCQVAAQGTQTTTAAPPPLREMPFITRQGDKLMEGDREFRFISFNHPNLHIIEYPVWRRVTPFEQEDGVLTISQMGGRVLRIYTLSVPGGRRNKLGPTHVLAPRSYNEELYRDLDNLLALCRREGIRVIIPFIDEWDWWGGVDQFAALRGRQPKEFYTDPEVREDYRDLIRSLVLRVNTVTGVAYKDDPTILAWETGNELRYDPESWVSETAAYIKSIDPKHLVHDGHCDTRASLLDDPNVDLFTAHYYGDRDYAAAARRHRELSKGKKPFYVGEFDPTKMGNLFDEVISNGCAGALVWSLRTHSSEGGFYLHEDHLFYHWPFDPITQEVRRRSFQIQGLAPTPVPVPRTPSLLPIQSLAAINWLGSTGAEYYRIERATSPEGPWRGIAAKLTDKVNQLPLASDKDAPKGTLYYRIRAINSSGASEWSTPVMFQN